LSAVLLLQPKNPERDIKSIIIKVCCFIYLRYNAMLSQRKEIL
jgi:hypothetical protein